MNGRARELLVAALVLSTAGSACLDFDKAQARFCVNASPAQRSEVCSVSQAALRVSVFYGASYEPACIRVTASDVNGSREGTDILRHEFSRSERREVIIALGRKEESQRQLTVQVASYEASTSAACSGNVLESYVSEPITVPPGESGTFEVTLQAQDVDQDEHILKTPDVAGTDCDDTNPDVHPGVPEVCNGTADIDCDGQAGCADVECLNQNCDDGNACTVEDRCRTGSGGVAECRGTLKLCEPPNFTCYTSESVCNPETGECVHTQRPAETSCNDGNLCTVSDQCGLDAACRGTSSVSCNNPPQTGCYETEGACIPATGQCSYRPKPREAACEDNSACTANQCDGAGNCLALPLPDCVPSSVCHRSERKECPSSATCTETVDPSKVNTPCGVGGRSGVCRQLDGVCSSFPFIPSNFDPDSIAEAARDLSLQVSCGSLTDPLIFDSTNLRWIAPAGCVLSTMPVALVITQGNVEITVVPMRSLSIGVGRALKLQGNRPVILAVYGDATLAGALLADADGDVPGAGGNRSECGTQKGGNGLFSGGDGSGGGGGGFGQPGAAGGRNAAANSGGGSGVAVNSNLSPLVGGCPGGTGGAAAATANGGVGGAGGGGLQLAVAGTLRVEYWVSVSGGGGRGGRGASNNAAGGGGGGSGGGLLLEAFHLQILSQARLTANGGGGGEGAGDTQNGSSGEDGYQSIRTPASGGAGGSTGADGGGGGADGVAAAAGSHGSTSSTGSGGGGGGGVGVIRMKGFGNCSIDPSCSSTDGAGCDISPRVFPVCPP